MKIRVPATTANIGPGFDTLGIALNLYNYFELGEKENINTLADKAFSRYFKYLKKEIPYYTVKITGKIPMSRGLGSSASLIVGGLVLANNLNGNYLSDDEILDLAVEIEGHSDNVTPAIFGGLCISAVRDKKVYYSKVDVNSDLEFIAIIPSYKLFTKKAREVLPTNIGYKEAIENMSNTAMIISSIRDDEYEKLKYFIKDNLHEPFRKSLIIDFDRINQIAEKFNCIGSYISGAGPTMMILSINKKDLLKIRRELNKLNILGLKADNEGYKIIK